MKARKKTLEKARKKEKMSQVYEVMTSQMSEHEDHVALISQIYPGFYTQIATHQGNDQRGMDLCILALFYN